MNRDQARDYINQQEPNFLQKAKKAGYICPRCGQGRTKGHGITRNSANKLQWHCVEEGVTRSVLGLFAEHSGIPDDREHFPEILSKAASYYGISIDDPSPYRRTTAQEDFSQVDGQNHAKTGQYTDTHTHTDVYTHTEEPDYTSYFAACHSRINDTDYHRGLSAEVLERFNIGFDPAWRHPKVVAEGKNPPATPRLIIPTSASSYLARDTRAEVPEPQQSYTKSKVGSVHILNLDALEDEERPCFIVEGEIDALSIMDVGGNAIALGSTQMVDRLLSILERRRPRKPLIIALDNDQAGEKAAAKLEEGLTKLSIPFYRRNPCEGFKDANEALNKDRDTLRRSVEAAQEVGQEEKTEYLKTSSAANLQSFIDGIAESVNTEAYPTGFETMDKLLDGGLYEGLYVIGAITSLGKTSFALQIADMIANSGRDVLIFSLEMARTELMSKSISRHTLQIAIRDGIDTRNAKTARGITDGKRYPNYSRTENDLIQAAIRAYGEYAGRLYIQEGVGDIGVTQIRETVEKHIRYTGQRPLVIVDYMQILAPYNDRATDKQNTDKAILELKRISRDFKVTVIAISSLNRMNYKEAVTLEAFKESGAIEYTSDVLIGLQLRGAGEKGFDATAEKKRNPREVELVILKNRQGQVGGKILFEYYPMFNYFEDKGVSN